MVQKEGGHTSHKTFDSRRRTTPVHRDRGPDLGGADERFLIETPAQGKDLTPGDILPEQSTDTESNRLSSRPE